jgi:hypothetical protein
MQEFGYYNVVVVKERIMPETRNRKRLIYSTKEFERTYLPKGTNSVEIPAANSRSDFGADLAEKITSRINIKM